MSTPVALTAALFVPPHNPGTVLMGELAATLHARSGGRLSLTVRDSEALGTTAEHYDLAVRGTADVAYMIHSATPGRFPLTELAALPPVANAVAGTAALQRLIPSHLQAEHRGVKLLALAANEPMAVHSVRPLRTAADFKGLRVGHTGRVIAATLRALGAEPVTVMPLQIRAALTEGRIDAATMTYEAALVVRLGELARHSFELDANTITFGLAMSAARYAALPEDLRRCVDEVLGPNAGAMLAERLAASAAHGREYMREAGVNIVVPTLDERAAFRPALDAMVSAFIAEREREGVPARDVYRLLKEGSS